MPMTTSPRSQGPRHLPRVVHLQQYVQTQVPGQSRETAQFTVVEKRGDQQHRRGAEGAGLVDLVRVDDEILAQQGQRGTGRRRPQVVQSFRGSGRPR